MRCVDAMHVCSLHVLFMYARDHWLAYVGVHAYNARFDEWRRSGEVGGIWGSPGEVRENI